jgi:hypothetical protein
MQKKLGQKPVHKGKNFLRDSPSTNMSRFMNTLRPGQMFFTRDCLNFGTRASIDKYLSRKVKDGTLKRLARGCFMLRGRGARIPSQQAIAMGKAKAFGKTLFSHGINCLKEFFQFEHPDTVTSYATNGDTSSFWSVRGRIKMRKYAQRKLTLGESPVGRVVRALWHYMNRFYATRLWEIMVETERVRGQELQELRRQCHLMPAWMVDIVKYGVPFRQDTVTPEQEKLLQSLKPRVRRIR